MTITLDNLELFAVPLETYPQKWIFEDEDDKPASPEHRDQIFPLSPEAAKYLWDYEMQLPRSCSTKYFKTVSTFDANTMDQKTIKAYLFDLSIPFSQKVFIAMQPDIGFVLTWKMVIKYSHNLFFAHDQIVYDRTNNWMLEFHHDGIYTFGRDLIFDGEAETLRNKQVIDELKKKLAERNKP